LFLFFSYWAKVQKRKILYKCECEKFLASYAVTVVFASNNILFYKKLQAGMV